MRALPAFGLAMFLAGCSLADSVERSSIDYNAAIEDVTNQLIVTNILRARDHAPLHFTDLSNIHGSLQLNNSISSTLPFGAVTKPTVRPRDLLTISASVTSSPAFDTAPLNSSGFTEGLLTPLPLKYLRYYLQRGVSQDLLLNLLVEKISFSNPGPVPAICDYPSTATQLNKVDDGSATSPCAFTGVSSFAELVQHWQKPIIFNDYQQLVPFGPPLAVNPLTAVRDLAGAGATALTLKQLPNGRFQFMRSKAHTAVCVPDGGTAYAPTSVSGDTADEAPRGELSQVCYRRQIETASEEEPKPNTRLPQRTMYLRSVKGVIEYLGEIERLPPGADRPILFNLHPGVDGFARINVNYDGSHFHVDDYKEHVDETILVLSIVNDLLSLIKKANETPNTPAVTVLQ